MSVRISSSTPPQGTEAVPATGEQGARPAPPAPAAQAAADVTVSDSLRARIEQANRSAAASSVADMNVADAHVMSVEQAAAAVQSLVAQPGALAGAHAGLSGARVLALLDD